MRPRPPIRSRIWTIPSILAVLMLIGLLLALVADGVWDGLASAALAGVLLYTACEGLRSSGT
ncbi:hypothetical protein [Methylobacterium marchantiae]|uniref:Uncharacterized protein n=1 Tax=Methylobacterium marchantiae TaxID=600331 RepID=A0ABW3WUH8_9HYPH|nr:hypothetical protein AIGOOFII_0783 [Methylobacterium marchantiae]